MKLKSRLSSVVGAALLLLWLNNASLAANCSGVTMPEKIQNGNVNFVLNGMGLRLTPILAFKVKVYVAGLYLTKPSNDAKSIIEQDQPRLVKLYFLRDLDRAMIRKAMEESFQRNAGAKVSQMKDKIDSFQNSLTGVRQGQTLNLTYIPGKGTTVALDGKEKAKIEGADFASALISLWLGRPPNPEVKYGMLGGKC